MEAAHISGGKGKDPVYAETHAQKIARESKERDERIAENLRKYGPTPKRQKRRLPFGQKHKPKPKKCVKNFAEKQRNKMAKLVAKIAESMTPRTEPAGCTL